MANRFAAASALALAAAVLVAQPARAQFFSFFQGPPREYALSPREIVGMLDDEGYSLRGPMMRRGGVYICNVVSVSGRELRLIVDARSGHVLERYAGRGDYERETPASLKPPRVAGRDWGDDDDFDSAYPRERQALGDPYTPPRRDAGDTTAPRLDDPAPPDAPKAKRHVAKKHATTVAKAPATPPTPDAAAGKTEPAPPMTAAVAPSAPAPTPVKPVEASKPAPVVAAPAPSPSPSAAPAPQPSEAKAEPRVINIAPPAPAKPEPAPQPTQAKAEPRAVDAAPAAPARKKLNDLPVGTLN